MWSYVSLRFIFDCGIDDVTEEKQGQLSVALKIKEA
jgi:hypothetical protein